MRSLWDSREAWASTIFIQEKKWALFHLRWIYTYPLFEPAAGFSGQGGTGGISIFPNLTFSYLNITF
jgi:hypothetical protein